MLTFWTYMLHCNGGAFYVGHTDDIEKRVWQHKNGVLPGFTRDHLPVKLVWCEAFSSREDPKAMEHRLKGWSRAKKLALIRGDFAKVSRLAKSRAGLRQAQAVGVWKKQATGEGKSGLGQAQPDGIAELLKQIRLPELVEGLPFPSAPKHPK